jgi:glycosyltransferase involved in cell wall biosynthesis
VVVDDRSTDGTGIIAREVSRNDARARIGQSRNDGAADALSGAGDDRAFTGEI